MSYHATYVSLHNLHNLLWFPEANLAEKDNPQIETQQRTYKW